MKKVTFIMSMNAPDMHGDIIIPSGIDLSKVKLEPGGRIESHLDQHGNLIIDRFFIDEVSIVSK